MAQGKSSDRDVLRALKYICRCPRTIVTHDSMAIWLPAYSCPVIQALVSVTGWTWVTHVLPVLVDPHSGRAITSLM